MTRTHPNHPDSLTFTIGSWFQGDGNQTESILRLNNILIVPAAKRASKADINCWLDSF